MPQKDTLTPPPIHTATPIATQTQSEATSGGRRHRADFATRSPGAPGLPEARRGKGRAPARDLRSTALPAR